MSYGPNSLQRNMYAASERWERPPLMVEEVAPRPSSAIETSIGHYMVSDWDDERAVPWHDFLADVEQAEEVYSEMTGKERVGEPRQAYDIFLPVVTSDELTTILRMADELPRRKPCSIKAERAHRRTLDKAARECLRSASLEESKKQAESMRAVYRSDGLVDSARLSLSQAHMLEDHPFGRPSLLAARVRPAPDQSGWCFDMSYNEVIIQERRVILDSLYLHLGIARGRKTAVMEGHYNALAQFYDFYEPEQGQKLLLHHGLNGPSMPDSPIAFEELSVHTT